MTDTRLIEILMPMEQASILSPREKNVRSGGYISTFHVWPSRKPIAATRAALLATLLRDPGDPIKRAELLKPIGGEVKVEQKESKDEDGNFVVEEKAGVRGGVLAWNTEDSEYMQSLREAIRKANGSKAPQVFDPFSGGGAMPLEAMWLGCHASASDINPVAWLLLKGTLEYPQRYAGREWPLPDFVNEWPDLVASLYGGGTKRRKGRARYHFSEPRQLHIHEARPAVYLSEIKESKNDHSTRFSLSANLSWHIRVWGQWVLERAQQELAKFYPAVNGEPPIAYLWARTVRDIQTEGRIPMLHTFMLCRKKGKRMALLPIPSTAEKTVTFKLLKEDQLSTAERRAQVIQDHPFLTIWGVTEDKLEDFLRKGTKSDAGVWSPFEKGRPDLLALTMPEIREQGRRGLMGFQMTAVCVESTPPGKKKPEKTYRVPTADEIRAADVQIEDIEDAFHGVPYGVIDDPLPPQGSLGFRVQLYGIVNWRQLFTPRQLLAAGVFVKQTRQAIARIRETDPENTEALAVYLTVVFGRFIDYCSTQCSWEPSDGEVKHTIAGYKLPMSWNFAECNPLSARDRYYAGGIRAVSEAVEAFMRTCAKAPDTPMVRCVSSLAMELNQQDLCFTDPPYYDAIPYADLMNFFRIWQKRIIGDLSPEFREVFEKRWEEKSLEEVLGGE